MRNTSWGDSKSEVFEKERNKPLENDGEIYLFECESLGGLEFNIFYNFKNDKLYGGGYLLDESFPTSHEVLKGYLKIINLLKEKYNSTNEIQYNWINPSGKQLFGDDIATCISYKMVELSWIFQNNNTYIAAMLQGTDMLSGNIVIGYFDESERDNINNSNREIEKSKL